MEIAVQLAACGTQKIGVANVPFQGRGEDVSVLEAEWVLVSLATQTVVSGRASQGQGGERSWIQVLHQFQQDVGRKAHQRQGGGQ